MKKLQLLAWSTLATLLLGSCNSDESITPDRNETVTVSYTASLAGAMQTRAEIGDGTTTDELIFQAKDQDGNTVTKTVAVSNKTATVTAELVKGQTYQIAFWAQKQGTYVNSSTADLGNITIDYTNADAQQDGRDAFFALKKDVSITKPISERVELKRPFAQVNFGAIDYEEAKSAGVEIVKTVVKGQGLYNQFNAFTGEASGSADATFTANPLPTGNITVNTDDYKYMAVTYVLAGEESSLVNMQMEAYKENETTANTVVSVNNLPVQRNYKTNIVGKLITASSIYEIIINPDFGGSEAILVWDGQPEVPANPSADPIEIANAGQLAWVSEQVANGNTFAGKTLKLTENINLGNVAWTPIGTNADSNTNSFQGTFDGNGKTISNLYVDLTATPAYRSAGLFGATRGNVVIKDFTIVGATIKHLSSGSATDNGIAVVVGSLSYQNPEQGTISNVKVVNARVEGNRYMGGIVGYGIGTITGCTVDGLTLIDTPDLQSNGKYDNGDKAGGIIGYINSGTTSITNNTVTNFSIKGYRDLGGIVGCGNLSSITFTGNTATNGTITVDQTTNSYGSRDANANSIVGRLLGGTIDTSNTSSDVTVSTVTNP